MAGYAVQRPSRPQAPRWPPTTSRWARPTCGAGRRREVPPQAGPSPWGPLWTLCRCDPGLLDAGALARVTRLCRAGRHQFCGQLHGGVRGDAVPVHLRGPAHGPCQQGGCAGPPAAPHRLCLARAAAGPGPGPSVRCGFSRPGAAGRSGGGRTPRLWCSAGYRIDGLHQDALMQVPDAPAPPAEESPDSAEPPQPVSLAPGQRFDLARVLGCCVASPHLLGSPIVRAGLSCPGPVRARGGVPPAVWGAWPGALPAASPSPASSRPASCVLHTAGQPPGTDCTDLASKLQDLNYGNGVLGVARTWPQGAGALPGSPGTEFDWQVCRCWAPGAGRAASSLQRMHRMHRGCCTAVRLCDAAAAGGRAQA